MYYSIPKLNGKFTESLMQNDHFKYLCHLAFRYFDEVFRLLPKKIVLKLYQNQRAN